MHDGAQPLADLAQAGNEIDYAGAVAEIGLQYAGATFGQFIDCRAQGAIADDQRMAFIEQAACAMQADALTGAGDQDGELRWAHGGLDKTVGVQRPRA